MKTKKDYKTMDREKLEELRVKARGQEKVVLNILLSDD